MDSRQECQAQDLRAEPPGSDVGVARLVLDWEGETQVVVAVNRAEELC